MIKECPGVAGIKIEGNQDLCPAVRKITSAGIPVFVQVGLTPQRSNQAESDQDGLGMTDSSVSFFFPFFFFHSLPISRLTSFQAQEIIDAAVALEKVGAVGLFLTALSEEAAKLVTNQVGVPTIGIGYVLAIVLSISISPPPPIPQPSPTAHIKQTARAARAAARSCSSQKCSATRIRGSRNGTASTNQSGQSRSRRSGTMSKRLGTASFRGKNWYNFRFCPHLGDRFFFNPVMIFFLFSPSFFLLSSSPLPPRLRQDTHVIGRYS